MAGLLRGGCVGAVDLGARGLVGVPRPKGHQPARSPHETKQHHEASEDPGFLHGVRSSLMTRATRGPSAQRRESVKGERGPARFLMVFGRLRAGREEEGQLRGWGPVNCAGGWVRANHTRRAAPDHRAVAMEKR